MFCEDPTLKIGVCTYVFVEILGRNVRYGARFEAVAAGSVNLLFWAVHSRVLWANSNQKHDAVVVLSPAM